MNEDRASRYHRLKRRSAVLWGVVTAAVLVWLHVSGASATIRGSEAGMPAVTVARYVLWLSLLLELVCLPFSFHRFLLERRYGLSVASLSSWLRDHAKAIAVSMALGVTSAEVVYLTLRHWPAWWWLASAALLTAGLVVLSTIAPTVLPLIYRLSPLDRDTLRSRLVSLSTRAGVPLFGVYRWDMGGGTRRANAALTGSGSTRRILLSDTLLDQYTDDEIEVIIAHELAHHVHHDLARALGTECIQGLAALFLATRVLNVPSLTRGLHSSADVAGLPLLLLTIGATLVAGTPLTNALSRRHERRADRFALTLTGKSACFISAMRRLAAQNLAEVRPHRSVVWFFHRHPPVHARIDAARDFERALDDGAGGRSGQTVSDSTASGAA